MGIFSELLGAGAGIVGGLLGADAEEKAQRDAVALQRETRDMNLRLAGPQIAAGNQALAQLGSLFGIAVPGLGDMNSSLPRGGIISETPTRHEVIDVFREYKGREPTKAEIEWFTDKKRQRGDQLYRIVRKNQPDAPDEGQAAAPGLNLEDLVANNPLINFTREQGEKAAAAGAAARGLNLSGGTLEELSRFNQGLSSAGIQDFVLNPLFQLAGFGPQATGMAMGVNSSTGNNLANLAIAGGNSRSSAFQNAGNIIGGVGLSGGFDRIGDGLGNLWNRGTNFLNRGNNSANGIPAGMMVEN